MTQATELQSNQSEALPWILGAAAVAGVIYILTRSKPAKAATSIPGPGSVPLPSIPNPPPPITPVTETPPPLPPPPAPSCNPTPELLAAFGNANGLTIWMQAPGGQPQQLTTTPSNAASSASLPQLVWTPGESVLRTIGGQVDQMATASFCSYVLGQTPLQCSISGLNFSKFAKWVHQVYGGQLKDVYEVSYPPPSLAELTSFPYTAGGEPAKEESTLVITRAPQEMVWRYYQGQPTAAPEIVAGFCQAVAAGTVQGISWLAAGPSYETGPPPDAVWWTASGAPTQIPGTEVGHLFDIEYWWDLGSKGWYRKRSRGPYVGFFDAPCCPEVPEVVQISGNQNINPPWRYLIQWYWSNTGWKKFREGYSYNVGDTPAGMWNYLV